MPQGNDLKDAKDIDPLGMTRDLFGPRQAVASVSTQEPEHPEAAEVGDDDLTADSLRKNAGENVVAEVVVGPTWDDEPADVTTSADDPHDTPDEEGPEDTARVSSLKEEITRELRTLLDDLAEPVAESDPKADISSP